MLAKRVLTAVLLLVVGIPAVLLGGIGLYLVAALIFAIASLEYAALFQIIDVQPSRLLVAGGVLAVLAARAFYPATATGCLGALVLIAMTWHVIAYERGRERAGLDFAVTLGGILYLGWIGAYLIDIRSLKGGEWWLLLVLVSIWISDSGAYFVGTRWGAHKMTPRLSPKKSWEGYAGGVASGAAIGALIAFVYQRWIGLPINVGQGALLGLVLGALPTLGDLGESMIKRQAGAKDSGDVFPGHGGAFDRIDSWLWGGILGFFFITWFIL